MMKKIVMFVLIVNTLFSQEEKNDSIIELTLQKAKKLAIENNYQIKKSNYDLKSAEKKVWETIAMGLPQVNAESNYINFLDQPNMLLPGALAGQPDKEYVEAVPFTPAQSLDLKINASMLIFDGSYIVGIMSAKVFIQISKLSKEMTIQTILEATVNSYMATLIAEENKRISENNFKNSKKDFNDTKIAYRNGLVDEQSYLQMKILLSNQENTYKKSLKDLKIAYMNLSLILGQDLETKYTLKENYNDIVRDLIDNDINFYPKLMDFNIEDNVEYMLAKNNTQASKLLFKKEQSTYLPSINTFLGYSLSGQNSKFDFFNSNQIWFNGTSFGVGFKWNLFSSFGRYSKVGQAKIEYLKSSLDEVEKKRELEVKLKNAKNNYTNAKNMYNTSKENLKLAEIINKKQKAKNKEGQGSSLDLNSSYSQLYRTQQEYLQSIFNLVKSKVEIDKIINKKR